jgi:hypothetical protein
MLAAPILFIGIRKALRAFAKLRILFFLSAAFGTAAAAFLCVFMYNTTIKTQPLLVIERGVRTVYRAGPENRDATEALTKERLIADGALPEGFENISISGLSDASVGIPRKSSLLKEGKGYVVNLGSGDDNIGVAFVLEEKEEGCFISSMRVLSKAEFDELKKDLTFFDAGPLYHS